MKFFKISIRYFSKRDPTFSMKSGESDRQNLKQYYLTQSGSQLSLNTSFVDSEFSGADFDDEGFLGIQIFSYLKLKYIIINIKLIKY